MSAPDLKSCFAVFGRRNEENEPIFDAMQVRNMTADKGAVMNLAGAMTTGDATPPMYLVIAPDTIKALSLAQQKHADPCALQSTHFKGVEILGL